MIGGSNETSMDANKELSMSFGANFGIQKRDVEIAKSVARIGQTGAPQGFSVQNTKNATEQLIYPKIIADAGLNKGVALSAQSLDPDTLKISSGAISPRELLGVGEKVHEQCRNIF